MPPLLPEYLSQPVQIIVQTASADTWPVWVGAAATLGGAAIGAGLGAWLGAKGAYSATDKANKAEFRRQGLKEALQMADRIDLEVKRFVVSIQSDASGLYDGGPERIKVTARNLDLDLTIQLRSLLKPHHKSLSEAANELHTILNAISVLSAKAETLGEPSLDNPLSKQGLDFIVLLSDIRTELRAELNL
ncbi:hypothetical protein [Halomonas sp. Cn5-12]|uniref:hypothetical protein n=1 Tax=Halomonas sp. Cn5-12 TaxID=2908885 RepID=UPI001F323823|nr:hypothetical protein [Halomonas sp. Cn5-12]MCF2911899.1 hypothetical protein [Halomonas sp. Cn5-12]